MKLSDSVDQTGQPQSKEEQRKIAEFVQLRADMKAHLKTMSKNELIQQIFELIDLYNLERHKNLNASEPNNSELAQETK